MRFWKMQLKGIFRAFWAVQRWLVSRQLALRAIFSRRLGFPRVSDTDAPVAAHRSGSQEHDQRPGSRRLRNGASFPHDASAPLADRGEVPKPGSLTHDEVYSLVAFLLYRSGII